MKYPAVLALGPSALLKVVEAATVDIRVAPVFQAVPRLGDITIFSPSSAQMQAGDTVNFLLDNVDNGPFASPRSWSQTISQSAFDPPCRPLTNGFTTGTVQVAANGSETRRFELPQDYDGSPLYFYTEERCGNGATFSINAPEEPDDRSYEAYAHIARRDNWTLRDNGTEERPLEVVVSPATSAATLPVLAWPDDIISFVFRSNVNLTVTQSSFSDPCNPLVKEDGSLGWSSRSLGGSTNGFVRPGRVNFTVEDMESVRGYVEGQCQKGGVWAINPPGGKTLAAFVELAMKATSESSIFDLDPEPIPEPSSSRGVSPASLPWTLLPIMLLLLGDHAAVVL
ncbi:hypothetical protein BKA70DRAFT_1571605 [Coprinopsis sp. MPI-PUGE-AT-0042]|nr:hypothetical protein BKA70DRAFT_1571605 [Coprinopsis sp. MPI-PUGE-AT-0042]